MKPHAGETLMCIATFPSEVEAEMARLQLEAHGIHACSSTDDCGSWRPWLQRCNGVRLMVMDSDAGRAAEILMHMKTEETP